jgi:PAS domain S-box-containing protein
MAAHNRPFVSISMAIVTGLFMLESELFAFLNSTADAAFAVDEQGRICSWNRAAERLFGYPSSEVLHKPCAEVLQGRSCLGTPVCTHDCAVTESAAAHREIPNYDLEAKTRGNQRIWINVSILVFQEKGTKRRLIVHLARDITDRKKNQELTQGILETARQLASMPNEPDRVAPVSPLTKQEQHVLRLLADGKTPAQAARTLRITPRTLRNHIHHANLKLKTQNRLEAVIHALRRGLI